MGSAESLDAIAAALGLDDSLDPWRSEIESSSGWSEAGPVPLPDATIVDAVSTELGFRDEVRSALVASSDILEEPAARRLVRHAQWRFSEAYDPADLMPIWPSLDGSGHQGVRLLWAYAALSLVGRARELHAQRGVDPTVGTATLADIGQQVWVHKLVHDQWGMDVPSFVAHHLNGHLFRIGRLQFQLRRWFLGKHGPMADGVPVLDVHIPEDGPLIPQACDQSIDAARRFFAAHFPDHGASHLMCLSWLLDPQLVQVLPAGSNIVEFQRRFDRLEMNLPVRSSILEFVFDTPPALEADDGTVAPDVLDGLPRDTRLQRAVLEHLRSGGRWWMTPGYATL